MMMLPGIEKRSRTGSISGRLRACSDLEETGIISRADKSYLKDLIISNDHELRAAMERYEAGDASRLEALLRRSRVGTVGSIDLVDGLDLDFLTAMGDGGSGDLFDDRAAFSEEDLYDELDGLSSSLHDLPRYGHLPGSATPFVGTRGLKNRKMSFDTLFGAASASHGVYRPRTDSAMSLDLGYGLDGGEGGGTDSEGGALDDPYVRHARGLEAKKPPPQHATRNKRSQHPTTSSAAAALIGAASSSSSTAAPKASRAKNARSSTVAGAGSGPSPALPKTARSLLPRGEKREPRPNSLYKGELKGAEAPQRTALSGDPSPAAEGKAPLSASQLLQIPKYSMSDGPSLSRVLGAYSRASRMERIQRFIDKRSRRVWTKKVKYDVRKNFADSRVRVKGRFVKKEAEDVLRQMLTDAPEDNEDHDDDDDDDE